MNTNDTEHRRNEIGVLTDIHPCCFFHSLEERGLTISRKLYRLRLPEAH